MYISALPIPIADSSQQPLCERLAEALIWLHRPSTKSSRDSDTNLMIGYFEQWLNGLMYELFFRDELHARKLKLFDETAKLNPPELNKLLAADKMSRLRELFEKAYDSSAPLRGSLFDLGSLESVRIIEDSLEQSITLAADVG
jgi:adenine-specific DNA-methyltransferase